MKILLIADTQRTELWDNWSSQTAEYLSDIDLVLSAGDLHPGYLEFIVTMLNVPLIYVRGNHDGLYDKVPPCGCVDADDRIITLKIHEKNSGCGSDSFRTVRIAGLGGSMRYRPGDDMYTEFEMSRRALRMRIKYALSSEISKILRSLSAASGDKDEADDITIFLTHAPCLGYGDLEDLPHRGFACFNRLLMSIRPDLHCYGHVHQEYGNFRRERAHPSGARLINCSGKHIIEI